MPADRATFEAVRQRVIASAPDGLSREQFDALLDSEIAKAEIPSAATRDMLPQSTVEGDPDVPMTPSQRRAARRAGQPAPAAVLDSMMRDTATLGRESLPVVGGIAGLALGGPAGAAIGAGGGEAWRQNLRRMVGESAPGTPTEAATSIGLDALMGYLPSLIGTTIPRAGRAGKRFQEVMTAAKDQPVETGKAGIHALRVAEIAERGGNMKKAAGDFLKRITDPSKGDVTYSEARDYATNIGWLLRNSRLPPMVKREVEGMRVALDAANAAAAGRVGKAEAYRAAMTEYRRAQRLKVVGAKTLKYGAGAAGLGAGYHLLTGD